MVKEDDQTNQALRLLGHSIGIVALGKKIVLVEGNSASLDKQLYGSILRSQFPSLVLVPSGGKQAITSFTAILENVLEKSIWGVDFFMLCDRDAMPVTAEAASIQAESKGKLRTLSKYHLENYLLDEAILALVFEHLEPPESWLRSPAAIREELRKIAETLISYAVALLVAREFRLKVGNVDLMPKDCRGKTEKEIIELLTQSAEEEKDRVANSLDNAAILGATERYFRDLTVALAQDDPLWKDAIPGKPLLGRFASKARIDTPRLKTAYIHSAKGRDPNPFKELEEIFSSFAAA